MQADQAASRTTRQGGHFTRQAQGRGLVYSLASRQQPPPPCLRAPPKIMWVCPRCRRSGVQSVLWRAGSYRRPGTVSFDQGRGRTGQRVSCSEWERPARRRTATKPDDAIEQPPRAGELQALQVGAGRAIYRSYSQGVHPSGPGQGHCLPRRIPIPAQRLLSAQGGLEARVLPGAQGTPTVTCPWAGRCRWRCLVGSPSPMAVGRLPQIIRWWRWRSTSGAERWFILPAFLRVCHRWSRSRQGTARSCLSLARARLTA